MLRVLAGAAAAVVAAAAIERLRSLRRLVVAGTSMEPTLFPGDRLLVMRSRRIRVGQLVAFTDPRRCGRLLVKRVLVHRPELLDVAGDNQRASTDSRHFGPIPTALVVGRPVYRYLPEGRRGRL